MNWHKIDVDSFNISLTDNNPLYLEINHYTKLDISVNKNVSSKLVIISNNDYDINIKLENDSCLTVNSLNKDNSVNVNVSLYEKSSITYNHSVLSSKDSVNNFSIKHLADSSISILNNNGINKDDNKLFFNIDGIVQKELKNIVCNQSSKIINFKDGNSKIVPDLIIDSYDIVANHAAYIGKIDEEELFYLKSRGINDDNIKKLLYVSILLGKMDLNAEKEKFNKKISEWW